ncbi:MAG: transcriptional regulator, partial [Acidobacteriota bacterium]
RWVDRGIEDAAGCDDRYFLPELHRLRGELLQDLEDSAERVEESFAKAAELCREQGAKALELRTAMSVARFRDRAGDRTAGRDELAACYEWFGEGLETPDLVEAGKLLRELS